MGKESDNSKKITDLIIQHLLKKQDHTDDLEGISLFVYESVLNELSERVLSTISKLIAQGILVEITTLNGKKNYELKNS
jgi:hypothetical protein